VEMPRIGSRGSKYVQKQMWCHRQTRVVPTLLEGEALIIWLELTTEQQDDYNTAKEVIEKAIVPMGFVSLDKFHRRKLQ